MLHTPSSDLGKHIWIKLIQLVRQHPTIYLSIEKHSSRLRRNRNEINQIWEDIAAEIGISVENCKRRWKGLKDVYSKIRKRRVQEDVLGIKARKKWLYEDAMSFMKFPFEQMYQKALENLQVDSDNWNIEDAECNENEEEHFDDVDSNDHAFEQIDIKIEDDLITENQTEDRGKKYLDFYVETDLDLESDKYDSTQNSEKDNGGNDESQLYVPTLRENFGRSIEKKAQLIHRAIRPKPYRQSLLSKSRSIRSQNAVLPTFSPPLVNLSGLKPLNEIIISHPTLPGGINCNSVILTSPNTKVKSHSEASGIDVTSTSPVASQDYPKIYKDKSMDSFFTLNEHATLLPLPREKMNKSSVELFFESMAHTVMNLPTRAQADIKMEICKLVTRAEIQYSLSQLPQKLESHKFKSEKG